MVSGDITRNPLWIAGIQLLFGEERKVNEGEIISTFDRFKTNPNSKLRSDFPLTAAFDVLKKSDWATNLKVLADYYVPR